MQLALYTFGLFRRPADDAQNDGFRALNDPVMAEVDRAPGLIARSGYASDPGPNSWGTETYPPFYTERGDGWSPATLSLWRDLESLMAFTYGGLHVHALRRGSEWFQEGEWPPLVLWWHENPTAYPTWDTGVARFMHLHENGPTPVAFTFRSAFSPDGSVLRPDPARIKALKRDAV